MSTICLCRRAGKLVIGFDAVVGELKAGSFGGVVLAADVSAKTEKEVRFHAAAHGKEVVKAAFGMDEADGAIGKRAGVLLVGDEGLFGSIKKQIDKHTPGSALD
ncbi:MAG: 50S ribosomal protein L7 [Lachnospiraceae bacterium]|nr:50S ribosomal protein L7 [Ruminococcus sp.]MCM1275325.1 50S ribosomal protein L7 [Lachnospiraceae bacterium]